MSPKSFTRDGARPVGGIRAGWSLLLMCVAEQPTVASFDVWTAGARAGDGMTAVRTAVNDRFLEERGAQKKVIGFKSDV